VLLLGVVLLGTPGGSWATALTSRLQLPLEQAELLADAAVAACRRQDVAVAVTVLDPGGGLQVFLGDDFAPPHSSDLSRQKAYTAVSLAAAQGQHTTGELVNVLRRNPLAVGELALPTAPVAGITPLPGGVVIRHDGQVLAGIGVSGARQGQIDEGCALVAESRLLQELDGPNAEADAT
jgi:uncharacterized protein GlcG (DUF336 family)